MKKIIEELHKKLESQTTARNEILDETLTKQDHAELIISKLAFDDESAIGFASLYGNPQNIASAFVHMMLKNEAGITVIATILEILQNPENEETLKKELLKNIDISDINS